MTKTLGKRAKHKNRARAAIQTAAIELYEVQGYDNTTVEEIVERAGVSERSFYRYFPRKELTLFSEDRSVQIAELIQDAPGELSPIDALHWAVKELRTLAEAETTPLDRRRQAIRRELMTQAEVKRQLTHFEEYMNIRVREALASRLDPSIPPGNNSDLRVDILHTLYIGVTTARSESELPSSSTIDEWFDSLKKLTQQCSPKSV